MTDNPAIHESDKLLGSPALKLAAEGWLSILQAGHGGDGFPLDHTESVMWIEEAGDPVSLIVWGVQDWRQEIWISESYTRPGFRGRGYFSMLYARLREIAIEKKLRRIAGGINIGNKVMQKAAERCGRTADYVVYAEKI